MFALAVLASPVSGLSRASAATVHVTDITSDGDGYCLVTGDGAVKCWGFALNGELGSDYFYQGKNYSDRPVNVPLQAGASAVVGSAGQVMDDSSYCALLKTATVACWGMGDLGQLGQGAYRGSYSPVAVRQLTGAVSLWSDGLGYCVLTRKGQAFCWGGGLSDVAVPVVGISHAKYIATDAGGYCAVLSHGTVACWPSAAARRGKPLTAQVMPGLSGVQALVGESSTGNLDGFCATVSAGAVKCWGYGADGELGPGSSSAQQTTPVTVPGVAGARSLSSDGAGYCATLTGGLVRCWGRSGDGELGDGTTTGSAGPAAVHGLSGVKGTYGALGAYCAQARGGALYCWGSGLGGELGDGSSRDSDIPVRVGALEGVTTMASTASATTAAEHGGSEGFCAVLHSERVVCWGTNSDGQLGDGKTAPSSVPVPVTGL